MYVDLADKLDIRNDYFRSASNTSNLMESLFWLAYEQKLRLLLVTQLLALVAAQHANIVRRLRTRKTMPNLGHEHLDEDHTQEIGEAQ